jgi:spoIIIJ-associated protein
VPETVQESGAEQDETRPAGGSGSADGETNAGTNGEPAESPADASADESAEASAAESDAEADVESDVESDAESDADEDRSNEDLLVREGDIAGDYLERLLDIVDYDGDIDLDVEASRAVVSIDGGEDLEKLVGPRGNVLEALQELTRLAVQQETGTRSRLMLDIAGWRADRRQELHDLGRATAERVLAGDDRIRLQPMTPFERKVVHDAVAAVEGVHSESEGEDPRRRVVVFRSS